MVGRDSPFGGGGGWGLTKLTVVVVVVLLQLTWVPMSMAEQSTLFGRTSEGRQSGGGKENCGAACWGDAAEACDAVPLCVEGRKTVCGSCISVMHGKNPLTICLILFFLLLLIGGGVGGYWYWKKKQRAQNQQQQVYYPDAQASNQGQAQQATPSYNPSQAAAYQQQ